ncbi:zf-HC2 domain-containing protein [Paenibacillus sp. YYML68]|uniref:zf-HC2 domain-containing protein n=1 Tax=Paenibacillus sp. YYML68 TaxID=2909250 RepID=UPI0024933596|nr:zf-HC2 domain-containing protein [Paenibacillus sp. YYML68]
MSHGSEALWMRYVKGTLPERERALWEEHLAVCDSCLELYMRSVEIEAAYWPAPDMNALRRAAMTAHEEYRSSLIIDKEEASLQEAEALRPRNRFRDWWQHPFFQYTAACVLTIVLMSSGVFEAFVQTADALEQRVQQQGDARQRDVSVSEQLVNRTRGLIEQILYIDKGERELR